MVCFRSGQFLDPGNVGSGYLWTFIPIEDIFLPPATFAILARSPTFGSRVVGAREPPRLASELLRCDRSLVSIRTTPRSGPSWVHLRLAMVIFTSRRRVLAYCHFVSFWRDSGEGARIGDRAMAVLFDAESASRWATRAWFMLTMACWT